MLGVLSAYVALWTLGGVIAKSSQDIHYDSAEVVAWSREFAGLCEASALAAWLVRGWFSVFPVSDWAYYLLAMMTAAISLWFAWLVWRGIAHPRGACSVSHCSHSCRSIIFTL